MKTYLFHGQIGAGKDTQVEMLLKKFDVERVSTGEMFRKMTEEGDQEAAELFNNKVKHGIWPAPEETFSLVKRWLKRFDPNKDWVLLSVARYAEQIPFLDEALKEYGRSLDKAVHFTIPEDVALDRLAGREICPKCQATYHPKYKPEKVKGTCDHCGAKLEVRKDDTPEGVMKRFEQYAKSIQPWIDAYKKRGLLLDIDATPSIEEIHNEVVKNLEFSNVR